MGVTGLWSLLEPTGRRVDNQAMAGKRLAVDASIWLYHFMRAMRDEASGDMVHAAHLKGFFSRISRLLFHKIKPVFVFDGTAPGLKRATLAARRKGRDVQTTNVTKLAEKMLLNNLLKQKLEAAKANQQDQRRKESEGNEAGPSTSAAADRGRSADGSNAHVAATGSRKRSFQEAADEELARQMQEVEDWGGRVTKVRDLGAPSSSTYDPGGPSTSYQREMPYQGEMTRGDMNVGEAERGLLAEDARRAIAAVMDEEDGLDEGGMQGFSAAELALMDARSRGLTVHGERAAMERAERADLHRREQRVPVEASRKPVDASIQAKAGSKLKEIEWIDLDMEEEEEGEEGHLSLLPSNIDELDPEVLSTLPQSVQLEILQKMRDARAAANRESFQEASDARPENFSSLQLANYLKASQFKQKMEGYKLQIGGGVQKGDETMGRRLASDSTREFIFRRDGEAVMPPGRGEEKESSGGGFIRSSYQPKDKDNDKDKDKTSRGLSKANAAALSSPLLPLTLAPLTTKIHLASFKGTSKEERMAQKADDSLNSGAEWEKVDDAKGSDQKGVLSISLEIKADEDLKEDVLFKSDNEDEGDEGEWEDADLPLTSHDGAENRSMGDIAFKEAILEKQKVWSTAHGFKFGRSLGDWRKEEEWPSAAAAAAAAASIQGRRSGQEDEEERNIQQAIQVSLFETTTKVSEDVEWEDADDKKEEEEKEEKDEKEEKEEEEGEATAHHLPSKSQYPHPLSEPQPQPQPPSEINQVQVPAIDVDLQPAKIQQEDEKPTKNLSLEASEPSPATIEDNQMMIDPEEEEEEIELWEEDPAPDPVRPASHSIRPDPSRALTQDAPLPLPLPPASATSLPPAHELDYIDIDAQLEAIAMEGKSLQWDQARAQRLTDSPTPQMYKEVQDLLTLFGIPFIIAPGEAEAQCAWLEEQGLVDGVVTDDNDAFLFGARHVYRHSFDHKKYVEEYRFDDVEREMGMSRLKLAQMALLLGSDYTEGVKGVGVVNAVEILNAFGGGQEEEERGEGRSGAKPLVAFREWLEAPDERLLEAAKALGEPRAKKPKRKKKSNTQSGSKKESDETDEEAMADEAHTFLSRFKEKHRSISKTWVVPASFPSEAVLKAYMNPNVDRDKSKFKFGMPDIVKLKQFTIATFGWTDKRADQLIAPVLDSYQAMQGPQQRTIHDYFHFNQRFAKIKSKRLTEALKAGPGSLHPESVYIPPPPQPDVADDDDEAPTAVAMEGRQAPASSRLLENQQKKPKPAAAAQPQVPVITGDHGGPLVQGQRRRRRTKKN